MAEFYLRTGDPLAPVYEVDLVANTWRLAASHVGVVPDFGGTIPDGGARFRSADFVQVWPKAEADGVVTYTMDPPAAVGDVILTAGVDVGVDRIECEVSSWRVVGQ